MYAVFRSVMSAHWHLKFEWQGETGKQGSQCFVQ